MSPILEFEHVTVEPTPRHDGLRDVSFTLNEGELALVRAESTGGKVALADAAEGLIDLASGCIRFNGKSWAAISAKDAAAGRGRIGRVFEEYGWISNLDVDENITLSERYHTARTVEEIRAEAEQMAAALGFSELPRLRPALMPRSDLQRAEWVRAFLGKPLLVLLERPMEEVNPALIPVLLKAVDTARAHGSAVMWITKHPAEWEAVAGRATVRFEMKGPEVVPMKGS